MTVLTVGLLVVAVLAFFVGVSLVVVNVTTAVLARAGVARGLSSIDNVYSAAALTENGERVGPGASNRLTELGRAATPRARAGPDAPPARLRRQPSLLDGRAAVRGQGGRPVRRGRAGGRDRSAHRLD